MPRRVDDMRGTFVWNWAGILGFETGLGLVGWGRLGKKGDWSGCGLAVLHALEGRCGIRVMTWSVGDLVLQDGR
jgi:hypothetical protein